jgi:hypothetical protein
MSRYKYPLDRINKEDIIYGKGKHPFSDWNNTSLEKGS